MIPSRALIAPLSLAAALALSSCAADSADPSAAPPAVDRGRR
ncbi:hypothetical protein [Kocuria sp. CNJ-770]